MGSHCFLTVVIAIHFGNIQSLQLENRFESNKFCLFVRTLQLRLVGIKLFSFLYRDITDPTRIRVWY
jgi:hypothetical protein